MIVFFFFSSRRRHTRYWRDWSSDVCSSDLASWEVAGIPNDERTTYSLLAVHAKPGQQGTSPRVPEAVRVELLGSFRVSVGSRVIEESEWRLRKAASLVKLLALAPQHSLHREQVMDLLWSALDSKAAANNLRYVLHKARRTLEQRAATPSRCLHLQGDLLALAPNGLLWVDAEAF